MATTDLSGRPWLQTFSGDAWCADEPEAYVYNIGEIAHALANLCRFAGHCERFYSVAQHSVLVADEVARGRWDIGLVRAALLHDAAEAYVVDLPHPIKMTPALDGYRKLCRRTEDAIARFFGVTARHDAIAHADLVLLATEKRDLLGPSPNAKHWSPLPPPRAERIDALPPVAAEALFIEAWENLYQRGAEAL